MREFTFGHTKQLASAARAHLVALAGSTEVLAGAEQRVLVDIDSVLRPVYEHGKQGASFGHTKIAGEAGPASRSVATDHHDQHPDRGPGDRRDLVARR